MGGVRAKFRCYHVERMEWASASGYRIKMHPVYSGSKENEEFYEATPGGDLILDTLSDATGAKFTQGKEYYLDFTEAPVVVG